MLKIEELKFMSIGANCADIGYLGKDRIRGPVDNMSGIDKVLCFECLFNGTFLDEFKKLPKIKSRVKNFEGDSDKCYFYNSFAVCHNNPFEEKFKLELVKRYNNFKNFYSHIQEPNYYFTYSLNTEISKITHTIENRSLIEREICFLKDLKILNKTIFVGTRLVKNKGNWDFYSNGFEKEFPEILYVEIEDLNIWHPEDTQKQFKEKVSILLNSNHCSCGGN